MFWCWRAGPQLASAQAFRTHQWPYQFRYRDLKGSSPPRANGSAICGPTKRKSRLQRLPARAFISLECGRWAARHCCGLDFRIAWVRAPHPLHLGPNEEATHRAMFETADEIAQAAGATVASKTSGPLGWSLHNVGTARMGSNPKTSVLNGFCQAHEVPNLFVVDGSCYVSSGYANPTLTMLAIGLRSSEYIIDQHKKGNLRLRKQRS